MSAEPSEAASAPVAAGPRWRRVVKIAAVAGAIAVACGLAAWFVHTRAPSGTELGVLPAGPVPHTEAQDGTASVLFVGDTHFGENYLHGSPDGSVLARHGYAYPLAELRPLLQSADLVIANLEAPLTQRRSSPLEGRKPFVHWADPERGPAELAAHNFGVVSLANNHAMDFLEPGLTETQTALAARGIHSIGAGADLRQAAQPYRHDITVGAKTVRLAIIGAFEHRRDYVAHGAYASWDDAGIYGLRQRTATEQIRALKRADPTLWVVIYPHWGRNYRWRRDEEAAMAHALVDAGADLVVGHGSHNFQEVEAYRGRWILYDLGNFMFLSHGRYGKRNIHPFSMAARLEWSERADGVSGLLRLYFIASDNTKTGFQPHLLDGRAFTAAKDVLLGGGTLSEHARQALREAHRVHRDETGYHVAIPVDVTPSR